MLRVLGSVAVICCIAVGVIVKKYKRQNVRIRNIQHLHLETIRSPETTQRTDQTASSTPLPNTTSNTIPQRENRYPGDEILSANNPVANHRPPPPYNESSNKIGLNEAPTVVPCLYMSPYPQQPPTPYQQEESHHLVQQQPSLNSTQPSAPPRPYETNVFNTLETNQGRQLNTSATVTSFATLPAHNPNTQASRQQASNVSNWEAISDLGATFENPACEFLGVARGETDNHNVEEPYNEVKTLRTLPPPSYANLFKK